MRSILEIRQRDAKRKIAYFSGLADTHPHGQSGKRFIIPPEFDRRCLDTAPGRHEYSEYGNDAGMA